MHYFTITPKDTVEGIITQIHAVFGRGNLYAYGEPESLMGNAKILVLRKKSNAEIVAKIDGPGFLIEEISKKFH